MKNQKSFVCLIILLTLTLTIYAQETKIEAIQTPPSPAFVLLGVEPTSISRPTTPRSVAVNLISSVQQGGAIEVAPYWLKSHKDLTFKQYMYPNLGRTFLQTLSISFATIPKTGKDDTLGTRVGLGMQFNLAQGVPDTVKLNLLKDSLMSIQNQINETDDNSKQAELLKEAKKMSLAIQEQTNKRLGFALAFAGAITMNFLDDNFQQGKVDKLGAWLTASYLLNKPSINLLAVARIISNIKTEGTQNVFDCGGRLVANAGNFLISCEYIQRAEINIIREIKGINSRSTNFFLKNTYRLTGNLEYKYNNDASVYLSFGKNFSNEVEDNGTLTAQVGLNLGFGDFLIYKNKDSKSE